MKKRANRYVTKSILIVVPTKAILALLGTYSVRISFVADKFGFRRRLGIFSRETNINVQYTRQPFSCAMYALKSKQSHFFAVWSRVLRYWREKKLSKTTWDVCFNKICNERKWKFLDSPLFIGDPIMNVESLKTGRMLTKHISRSRKDNKNFWETLSFLPKTDSWPGAKKRPRATKASPPITISLSWDRDKRMWNHCKYCISTCLCQTPFAYWSVQGFQFLLPF